MADLPLTEKTISALLLKIWKKSLPYTVSSYYDKLNSDDAKTTELLNFNSGDLTFTTINAIKELNNKIEALRAENEALKIRVEILETR